MITYKLTRTNTIYEINDTLNSVKHIPVEVENPDYLRYLEWIAAGNTPTPADPIPLIFEDGNTLSGRVRTNDATTATLFRQTLRPNTGYIATMRIIAVDLGNGNVKTLDGRVTCKRLGGNALMVGTPTVLSNHQDAGAASWTVTGGVSGTDFVITITGEAGRQIMWSLTGEFTSFTPQGR